MIRETIITTISAAGQVHIAPMGIREQQQGLTVLAPFRPSTTLDNVTATGVAVINYCDDVRIFAGCLTGRRDWPLVPATAVRCLRLEAALAHDELRLERIEDDTLRPRLLCHVVQRANHKPFRGFNRAQAAVIEAAVLVSRLDMLPHEKIDAEIAYLTIAIDKTAGAAEREAWDWLMQKIAAHRTEHAERPA
ncbi:MAG TPA: DUF447 domain-containing protein [Burkholderiales bacterium]|nr:DUF447 domain-containing protein [Burkholderiales bacterium]